MTVPAWLLDIFAAIMLLVAAVSAARLIMAPPWRAGARRGDSDVDAAHLLMGIAMAGMLAAGLQTLPNGDWIAVFAIVAAWFAVRVAGDLRQSGRRSLASSHHLPHLIHSAAMVYMYAALTAPSSGGGGMGMAGGSGGMGTLRLPTIALAFALLLVWSAVWDLDGLPAPARRPATARLPRADPPSAAAPALAVAGGTPDGAAAGEPGDSVLATVSRVLAGGRPGQGLSAAGPGAPAMTSEPGSLRHWLRAGQVATGCRIAMGVTMALTLMIMI